MLVVNKPKGMVVHPAVGNYTGTLVNAVMYHCGERLSSINGVIRPGIVHRIDKDTSGLLMIAKSDMAHESLSAQLAAHSITRRYTALVYDNLVQDEGTVGTRRLAETPQTGCGRLSPRRIPNARSRIGACWSVSDAIP